MEFLGQEGGTKTLYVINIIYLSVLFNNIAYNTLSLHKTQLYIVFCGSWETCSKVVLQRTEQRSFDPYRATLGFHMIILNAQLWLNANKI